MTRSRAWVFTLAVAVAIAAAAPAAAQPSGQMTWAVHVSLAPTWFDPAETSGIITPFMVLYALHDALVKPMPGNAMAPSLAESWTMSKDGLTYEFVLRKGVKFHNGDVVTAEDVKFSFERYRGASAADLKAKMARVEVVDPHRVRFTLKRPWPDFMTFYATPATGAAWIVPKKYIEQVGWPAADKTAIGSGPYKVTNQVIGDSVTFQAVPDHWRAIPRFNQVKYLTVPEERTRVALVRRGQAGPVARFSA